MKANLQYFINLDERGKFFADVRRDEKTIFEIHDFDIFEEGWMKHKKDLNGLLEYLIDLGIAEPEEGLTNGN